MKLLEDHVVLLVLSLVVVLTFYVILVALHGTNPKLMDGVLILIGGIAALARPK